MDTDRQTGSNGAATAVDLQQPQSLATLLPVCPLENLPQELHQYIHAMESRIAHLELEAKRFEDALLKAGQFIFDSPMSKIMLAAFPKEAQNKLRETFGTKKP
jgi:hypothetical protein